MWNGWLLWFRFACRVRRANLNFLQLRPLSAPFIRNAFEREFAQLYIRYSRAYSFVRRAPCALVRIDDWKCHNHAIRDMRTGSRNTKTSFLLCLNMVIINLSHHYVFNQDNFHDSHTSAIRCNCPHSDASNPNAYSITQLPGTSECYRFANLTY